MSVLDRLRAGSDSTGLQIILILVVISFVYYGKQHGNGKEGATYATVNGHAIIDEEFRRAYRDRNLRTDEEKEAQRQVVLDNLIESEVLRQEAERLGVYVSDIDVAEQVLREPAFKNEKGLVDETSYADGLKNLRMSKEDFEDMIRKRLLTQKMQRLVFLGGIATEDEIQDLYVHNQTTIDISYVRVPPNRFADEVDTSETAIRAFIAENKERIATSYKEDFERLFKLPEKAQVAMIRLDVKSDGVTADELKARIEKVRAEAAGGADFAELAKRHSEDAHAVDGGDLGGMLDVANLPSEVADAIKDLKPGDLSQPVVTADQVRLYKVIGREAAREVPLEEAEPEIAKRLLKEEKEPKLAAEYAEKVLASWTSETSPPTGLLAPKGFDVKETAAFQPEGGRPPGGIPSEMVKDATAAESGTVLPKVYESGGIYYVGALHERQVPDMERFEKEKDHIRETILAARRSLLWDGYIAALVKRASVTKTMPGLPKQEQPAPEPAPAPAAPPS